MDNTFDKLFYNRGELLGGTDESGVIDIAGPLVAACVILPKIDIHRTDLRIFEVSDSKATPEKYRKQHAERVWQVALAIGIGEVTPNEVDYLGKREASSLSMLRAVVACQTLETKKPMVPNFLIVDGNRRIDTNITQEAIIKADVKSLTTACASIVAKVYRDDIMVKLHNRFPYYNWLSNKGAPCEDQYIGLDRFGAIPGIHRTRCWPFIHNPKSEKSAIFLERRRLWKRQTKLRLSKELI